MEGKREGEKERVRGNGQFMVRRSLRYLPSFIPFMIYDYKQV